MKTTLRIQNVKCNGCANTITKKLLSLEHISEVLVNVEDSTVTLDYLTDEDLSLIISMLKNLGYPIEGEQNTFGEKAKSYLSCAIGRI